MNLALTMLVSVVMGTGINMAVGLDASVVVPSLFLGSITLGAAKVFMPTGMLFDVAVNSSYAGEVLAKLLVRATTGNQLVEGGHIRVEPNVNHKFYIPRIKVGKMLQKRKEMPKSSDSKGDFNVDEKVLEPKEFMAYTEFNPRSFERFWRPYQPDGELVFRELPTDVQNTLLAELAKVVDFELGDHFINGEYAATGDNKLFNGILKRITDDTDVIKVADSVAVTLTKANIIDKMEEVRKLIPKALRGKKNLKYFMSVEDADLYDDALSRRQYKGANYTDVNPERYKSIQIVPLADWPKDVIVCTIASMDLDTNFWAGVAHVNDAEAIKIDRVTNAGEKYFFKMLMKADTNIAFGEEVVFYDGR